jgi:GAF domain-containing protein
VATLWERLLLTDAGPVADAVRERRLVWLADQTEMAHRYPRAALILPYPVALAAAPLTSGSRVWGGLVLLWPASRLPRLGAGERGAIHTACAQIGSLLRQADADGRPVLPAAAPHTAAPPLADAAGLSAADLDAAVLGGWCALDPAGRVTFISAHAAHLLGSSVPDLLGALPWEVLPWLDHPVFEDHYRAAVVSRQATCFTALRPPDRWLDFQLHPDASGISVRIAPASRTGPAHGTEPPGREPSGPLSTLPTRAGALYDLMRLAGTLTDTLGAEDVAERAADHIMPALGAQGFVLTVIEGDRLRAVGHRGYRREAIEHFDGSASMDTAVPTARAVSSRTPLFFTSPSDMEPYDPRIPRLTRKAGWAVLPLIASGRPVGCCVVSYEQPHSFTPDERALLISLAGLIAQALDRARLYDAKLRLAQGLQAALLPAALPQLPGLDVAARYLPATHGMDIGGDFYDLIQLDTTAVAAVIGDVQGHNVNAAALMGQVRTAVRATAGTPPSHVLARTNRLLTGLDPELFTSCTYAHLDLTHHCARLATAGHPPPLLRHPDGHTETLELPPGLLLGIDPAAEYRTTEIPLPPGTVLALYTDGLIETPGTDPDDATAELADRLARARPGPLDTLADTLIRHPGPHPHSDDIALLLLRTQPTPPPTS